MGCGGASSAGTGGGRIRRCGSAALPALGGLLAWCGVEPLRLWPSTLLCLAPLVAACASCRASVALLRGLIGGFAINVALFYWFVPLLHRFAGLPWSVSLLAGAALLFWQSIPFALLGWAIARSRRPLLVVPAALVALEFLWPTLFPWHIGFPLGRVPLLIQSADLVGHGIASMLCATTGAAVVVSLRERSWRPCLALGALGLLVVGYGAVRMRQVDARRADAPHLAIGVVQPNRVSGPRARDAGHLAQLVSASQRLAERGADVVAWPETAYPGFVDADPARGLPVALDGSLDSVPVPLVFGARLGSMASYANSVLLRQPNGDVTGRYDKVHLVPFSESRPLDGLLGGLWAHFPRMLELEAGTEATVLRAAGARLGPLVCVEDLVPSAGREAVRLQADLLVNLTNDSWFGTTHGARHHLTASVFRAIETRRDLVRCTATGVSAHVDAAGRIRRETRLFDTREDARPVGFVARAARLEGVSAAVRVRDAFPWACAALALLFLFRRQES